MTMQFLKHRRRNRCLWRETLFMRYTLSNVVNPVISLMSVIMGWHEISILLREAPRKRRMQMEKISILVKSF
jgi:hypothetical protein